MISQTEFSVNLKRLSTFQRSIHELIFIFMFWGLLTASNAQNTAQPARVISLSPHITETIFKLKADHLLIGRTDFCKYPSAAGQIESVGGYLNIDFEKIVALKPDLVFQFPNAENRRKLEALGLRVISVPNETIGEILDGIRLIGQGVGELERAEQLISNIQDTLSLAAEAAKEWRRPLMAMLVVGRQPGSLAHLYLAGTQTFLSELWSLCGGSNVFSDINHRYFAINAEDILSRDIEMILEFQPDWNLDTQQMQSEKKVWSHFSTVTAVQQDRIYLYPEQFYVIPGPRITLIAMEFSKIIRLFWEEAK